MSNKLKLNDGVKRKVLRKKKANDQDSDEEHDTESSEEELDLTKECHPISHYLGERAEMINQMFSVIKGKKLKAMLPPILRDYDLEQLKLQCLDQLLGMSEKRIQCILEGETLDTSSESDIASDESDESKSSSDSASSHVVQEHASQASSKRKYSKRKSDSDNEEKVDKKCKVAGEGQGPDEGKTLLEILELEMRARAIRALLKQGNETPAENTETTEVETVQPTDIGEVVDLTEGDDDYFPRVIKTEPESVKQEQTFEEKVEKTAAKSKEEEEQKKQRVLAENEIRNRLIKKKTYRTRQQRLENDEDEESSKELEPEALTEIKKEPEEVLPEAKEIVIEDPEEGEVSSEEELDVPVVVKQEKSDSPEPEVIPDKVMDGERILAIDDGNFVADKNVEFQEGHDDDVEILEKVVKDQQVEEIDVSVEDKRARGVVQETFDDIEVSQNTGGEQEESSQEGSSIQESNIEIGEETSWRERWLNKDDVQKVVKSSKICGKVKKRIANKKRVTELVSQSPDQSNKRETTRSSVVEGSVLEYKKLFKGGGEPSKTAPSVSEEVRKDDRDLNN